MNGKIPRTDGYHDFLESSPSRNLYKNRASPLLGTFQLSFIQKWYSLAHERIETSRRDKQLSFDQISGSQKLFWHYQFNYSNTMYLIFTACVSCHLGYRAAVRLWSCLHPSWCQGQHAKLVMYSQFIVWCNMVCWYLLKYCNIVWNLLPAAVVSQKKSLIPELVN